MSKHGTHHGQAKERIAYSLSAPLYILLPGSGSTFHPPARLTLKLGNLMSDKVE